MRLDKFLKVSRIIKRRSLAKEIAEQGRIKVNGKVVKPSVTVAAGDELEIRFGHTVVTALIRDVKEHVRKDEAELLYTIVKEERLDEVE